MGLQGRKSRTKGRVYHLVSYTPRRPREFLNFRGGCEVLKVGSIRLAPSIIYFYRRYAIFPAIPKLLVSYTSRYISSLRGLCFSAALKELRFFFSVQTENLAAKLSFYVSSRSKSSKTLPSELPIFSSFLILHNLDTKTLKLIG